MISVFSTLLGLFTCSILAYALRLLPGSEIHSLIALILFFSGFSGGIFACRKLKTPGVFWPFNALFFSMCVLWKPGPSVFYFLIAGFAAAGLHAVPGLFDKKGRAAYAAGIILAALLPIQNMWAVLPLIIVFTLIAPVGLQPGLIPSGVFFRLICATYIIFQFPCARPEEKSFSLDKGPSADTVLALLQTHTTEQNVLTIGIEGRAGNLLVYPNVHSSTTLYYPKDDPEYFLKNAVPGSYDLIFMRINGPGKLSHERFLSEDFCRSARNALSPKGILAISFTQPDCRAVSILKQRMSMFKDQKSVSGTYSMALASKEMPLTLELPTLYYRSRQYFPGQVHARYLDSILLLSNYGNIILPPEKKNIFRVQWEDHVQETVVQQAFSWGDFAVRYQYVFPLLTVLLYLILRHWKGAAPEKRLAFLQFENGAWCGGTLLLLAYMLQLREGDILQYLPKMIALFAISFTLFTLFRPGMAWKILCAITALLPVVIAAVCLQMPSVYVALSVMTGCLLCGLAGLCRSRFEYRLKQKEGEAAVLSPGPFVLGIALALPFTAMLLIPAGGIWIAAAILLLMLPGWR